MLVREVMTHEPVTVRPFTTVKQALRVLAENRVTVLPVLSGNVIKLRRDDSRPGETDSAKAGS